MPLGLPRLEGISQRAQETRVREPTEMAGRRTDVVVWIATTFQREKKAAEALPLTSSRSEN
jgi:hypothetical protein